MSEVQPGDRVILRGTVHAVNYNSDGSYLGQPDAHVVTDAPGVKGFLWLPLAALRVDPDADADPAEGAGDLDEPAWAAITDEVAAAADGWPEELGTID